MLMLIENGELYTPLKAGRKSILIAREYLFNSQFFRLFHASQNASIQTVS